MLIFSLFMNGRLFVPAGSSLVLSFIHDTINICSQWSIPWHKCVSLWMCMQPCISPSLCGFTSVKWRQFVHEHNPSLCGSHTAVALCLFPTFEVPHCRGHFIWMTQVKLWTALIGKAWNNLWILENPLNRDVTFCVSCYQKRKGWFFGLK